ncbi:MAG: acyltransferase family protein, partial [Alphaproteobacteria bacterium]
QNINFGRRNSIITFKEKFIRLGIPFLIGIPLIVPLLAYPKYEHFIQPGIGYLDFWYLFLTERIQAGPNWVMYAIFLYSAVMVLAYKAIRPVFNLMACFVTWATRNPVPGFITVGAISATILGISDLIWGAPWWMGKWVFHLQSSRFILVAFFFTLGAAFAQAGLADNKKFMEAFSDKWILWVGLVALFGIPYMWYSTTFYHEGAFNEDIRIFFSRGGSWGPEAWDIIFDAAPPILIRTTMHGFMCLSQALALLAVFYKFVATPTPMWTSLARNCYGIFIIHEAVMVWSQYMLTGSGLPIPLKFAFVFIVGLSVAWTVNDKVLLKIPLVKRVLSPNG